MKLNFDKKKINDDLVLPFPKRSKIRSINQPNHKIQVPELDNSYIRDFSTFRSLCGVPLELLLTWIK